MIKVRSNGNGKGGMTVSEAGRKGGERVRDERGVGFYQEIGRKGGELGGRKGGEAVRDKYGPSFYEEIGRKGGQKVRELIEQGKKRIL
jgi:general stress protein YciG